MLKWKERRTKVIALFVEHTGFKTGETEKIIIKKLENLYLSLSQDFNPESLRYKANVLFPLHKRNTNTCLIKTWHRQRI